MLESARHEATIYPKAPLLNLHSQNVLKLEKRLNYHFKDKKLLAQALTHRSLRGHRNNERLEFLGDAVLDLVVGEFLFNRFVEAGEGSLSKMRSSLVSEEAFFRLASSLELGECILLSASQEHNGGRHRARILSDAFEALMGVVYLESGLEELKRVFYPLLQKEFEIGESLLSEDYKSALQEYTQEKFACVPDYLTVSEEGPEHNKSFVVEVSIKGEILALAKGSTKKKAQQGAAKLALEALREGHKA